MGVRKAPCKGVTVTCHKQFLCRELNKGFRNRIFCNKPGKERKKGREMHALQVDGCSKKVNKKERVFSWEVRKYKSTSTRTSFVILLKAAPLLIPLASLLYLSIT